MRAESVGRIHHASDMYLAWIGQFGLKYTNQYSNKHALVCCFIIPDLELFNFIILYNAKKINE